jgi:hypothetical protein
LFAPLSAGPADSQVLAEEARRAAHADAAAGVPHPLAEGLPPFLERVVAHASARIAFVNRRGEHNLAGLEAEHARAEVERRSAELAASEAAARACELEQRMSGLRRSRVGDGLGRWLYWVIAAGSLLIDWPLNRMAFERLPISDSMIQLLSLGVCAVIIVLAHLLGTRLAGMVVVRRDDDPLVALEDEMPSARAAWVSSALLILLAVAVVVVVMVTLNELRGQSEQFSVKVQIDSAAALAHDRLDLFSGHRNALLSTQALMLLVMTWLRFETVLGAGRRELTKALRRSSKQVSKSRRAAREATVRHERLAVETAATRKLVVLEVAETVESHRAIAALWYEGVVQRRPEQQDGLLRQLDAHWEALLPAELRESEVASREVELDAEQQALVTSLEAHRQTHAQPHGPSHAEDEPAGAVIASTNGRS